MLRHLENALTGLARTLVGIAFAVMIAAVLTQVVGRTIGNSPVWTEELTRFAMLFIVAFGVGLSLKTGELVNVDVVCESLPGPLPRLLRLLCAAIVVGFSLLIIPEALKFFAIGAFQKSPAMGLRMDVMHATIIVFLGGLALFGAFRIFDVLTGRDTPRRDNAEDA